MINTQPRDILDLAVSTMFAYSLLPVPVANSLASFAISAEKRRSLSFFVMYSFGGQTFEHRGAPGRKIW
jgi:hypothetical protein